MSTLLEPGARVLFQGDSITDAGRDRNDDTSLGFGYANFVAAWLSAKHPERSLTFINRGISGNRVYDLEGRWTEDCFELKPDWLSIMIGINDTWRTLDSSMPSPIPEFSSSYRRILDRVRNETSARIIIMEPFFLAAREPVSAWREDLDPRIDAVREIARDYGAIYIPLDGIFAAASTQREPAFWAADGVHPTPAGHALIAQAWMKSVR